MSDLSSIGPSGQGPVGPSTPHQHTSSSLGGGSGVNRVSAATLHFNSAVKAASALEVTPSRAKNGEGDRVELSDFARYLDKLASLPDVRLDSVTQVRQAIADETYESDEKIDAAIERWAQEEL